MAKKEKEVEKDVKPVEKQAKKPAAAKKETTTKKGKEVSAEKAEVVAPVVENLGVIEADKKSADELSVEQRLTNLYKLQTMLSEIDKIKTLRGELPLEVQDLEDEVAGLQTRIQNFQLDTKEIDTAIGQQRIKITDSNALVIKYKEQLDNVRNNREYDNLSKEIEFQGLEVELAEKHIREFTVESKAINEEIVKSKTLLSERQVDLKSKKEELNEIISETKIQEEKLREKAKQLETTIEPRLLAAFKRIRKSARNGLAVVYIQRDACGGCFNKIPPQRQLDIKLRKKTIVCEHCGRIMIDPQLAGVE
jgi:predicted  nucleic acid-binding Zn-ribbon protein